MKSIMEETSGMISDSTQPKSTSNAHKENKHTCENLSEYYRYCKDLHQSSSRGVTPKYAWKSSQCSSDHHNPPNHSMAKHHDHKFLVHNKG